MFSRCSVEGHLLSAIKKFGEYDIPHIMYEAAADTFVAAGAFAPLTHSVSVLLFLCSETAVLAVSVVNENEDVVGFASFLDAPPHGLQFGDLSQDRWAQWFGDTFRNNVFNVENTVWMTFFVADPDYESDAADRILQTVFSTLPYLAGILALVPLEVEVFSPVLADMFEQLPLVEEDYYGPKVLSCPRQFFIPPLTIRRARIEDHDDLVPIFDEQSEVLTDIYGEFFLAELIESQNAHNHSLVADVNGRAVGLMSLSDEVDTRLLRKYGCAWAFLVALL